MEINKEIKNSRVLVVSINDEKEELPKEYSLDEALSLADELGLDLIKLSETDKYAVCSIMEYTKYLYKIKKKHKNNSKTVNKEIKFSVNISDNDIETKLKNIRKMLFKGNRVTIKIELRNREIKVGKDRAYKLINRVVEGLGDSIKSKSEIKVENNNITMVIN